MQESLAYSKLKSALGAKVLGREEHLDRDVTVLAPEAIVEAVKLLMADSETGVDMLIELAGADYSGYAGRDEATPLCVSYHFYSSSKNLRAWLKVYLPLEKPALDSLVPLLSAANWFERECWDMYGVVFKGHPYLKRILLYEEFQGHPLRKDYPIMKSQPLIPMRNAVDYEAVAVRRRAEEGKA